jgi:hypothetical protein
VDTTPRKIAVTVGGEQRNLPITREHADVTALTDAFVELVAQNRHLRLTEQDTDDAAKQSMDEQIAVADALAEMTGTTFQSLFATHGPAIDAEYAHRYGTPEPVDVAAQIRRSVR